MQCLHGYMQLRAGNMTAGRRRQSDYVADSRHQSFKLLIEYQTRQLYLQLTALCTTFTPRTIPHRPSLHLQTSPQHMADVFTQRCEYQYTSTNSFHFKTSEVFSNCHICFCQIIISAVFTLVFTLLLKTEVRYLRSL